MFCTLYDGRIPRPRLSQGALKYATSCDALSAKRVGSVTVADAELKACIRAMQLMRCAHHLQRQLCCGLHLCTVYAFIWSCCLCCCHGMSLTIERWQLMVRQRDNSHPLASSKVLSLLRCSSRCSTGKPHESSGCQYSSRCALLVARSRDVLEHSLYQY